MAEFTPPLSPACVQVDRCVWADGYVLLAVGISEDGHRSVLGASCALSEAEVHWRAFLESLQQRGLHGVRFIASGNHQGLRQATSTHESPLCEVPP